MSAARFLSLKDRTSAFQAGNAGFKSRRSCCGHRIVVIKRKFPMVTPWMGMPSGEGSGL